MRIAILAPGSRGDIQPYLTCLAAPCGRCPTSSLADSISTALSDPGILSRAKELGERIRAENGITRAVKLIENLSQTCRD